MISSPPRAREQAAPRRRRLRRLFTDPPRPRPRPALPWGLVGALVLIVAAESFIARHPDAFSEPARLGWGFAAAASSREAPGHDVLFFGDSLTKFGLAPRAFTARTGLSAYNLAVGRGHTPMTFFLLRRALEAGARPRAVVVNYKASTLSYPPAVHGLSPWQEALTPRECLELADVTEDRSLLIPILVGRLLPSVRSRLEVRQNLQAALAGYQSFHQIHNRVARRNWAVNGGAHIAPRSPSFSGVLNPVVEGWLLPDHRLFPPWTLAFVDRFLDYAADRKLPVYWLLPPAPPQSQHRRERGGGEACLVQFVRAVCRRYPNVTVLDARYSGYDNPQFMDFTHLNRDGALALTRDVADVVRRDLNGERASHPRWIALPDYRPEPDTGLVEDSDESRAAVLGAPPQGGARNTPG